MTLTAFAILAKFFSFRNTCAFSWISHFFSQCLVIFRYVLLLTLALLVVYMLSTFTTLVWLACPIYGNLARFMGNYQVVRYCQSCPKKSICAIILSWSTNLWHQDELRKSAGDSGAGDETEAKALLGELFEIYYDNRRVLISAFYFPTFEKADCSIFALSFGWSVSPLIFLLLYNR